MTANESIVHWPGCWPSGTALWFFTAFTCTPASAPGPSRHVHARVCLSLTRRPVDLLCGKYVLRTIHGMGQRGSQMRRGSTSQSNTFLKLSSTDGHQMRPFPRHIGMPTIHSRMADEANLALVPCAAVRHVLYVACYSDIAVETAAPATDRSRGADATPLDNGWCW